MSEEKKKESKFVVWGLCALFGGLIMSLGFVFWWSQKHTGARPEPGIEFADSKKGYLGYPSFREAKEFDFVDARGNKIGKTDLLGKVSLVNFMFTSCPGPCRMMTAQMRGIQKTFQDEKGFQLVSISVDPDTDTPEVLLEYASSFGANLAQWIFATGKKEQIYELARNVLKLTAGEEPSLHSTKLVLFDQEGRHRGFFSSEDTTDLDRLREEVKALLKASS